jgi:hypothetical protein
MLLRRDIYILEDDVQFEKSVFPAIDTTGITRNIRL